MAEDSSTEEEEKPWRRELFATPDADLPASFYTRRSNGERWNGDWAKRDIFEDPPAIAWAINQFKHASLAKYADPIPAPYGGFPQSEFTCPADVVRASLGDAAGQDNFAVALRVVFRARTARVGEEGFTAVVEIAFRGSSNVDNWLTNLNLLQIDVALGVHVGKVHQGFMKAYGCLRASVLQQVEEGAQRFGVQKPEDLLCILTGHSLGGALATLAAYDLASLQYSTCLSTFGAPRVGDQAFAESFAEQVPRCVRFVNKVDPVPFVPHDPDAEVGSSLDSPVAILQNGIAEAARRAGLPSYRHVQHATEVDREETGVMENWGLVVQALGNRIDQAANGERQSGLDRDALVPHTLRVYAENLQKLAGGGANGGGGTTPGDLHVVVENSVRVTSRFLGCCGFLQKKNREPSPAPGVT